MVDSVKLLNHTFSIVLDDTLSETGQMGRASLRKCTIKLNSDMVKDALASTLLHELVHMIADINSMDLKEQDVDNIASGFLSLLKDNKDILEGLR